jgi:hypothetical protein
MILLEVSMKLEHFKPWFQIFQILEKHYAGGCLKSPPAVRLTASGYHKVIATQWFAKYEKFEILPYIVQNCLKLPKFFKNILI